MANIPKNSSPNLPPSFPRPQAQAAALVDALCGPLRHAQRTGVLPALPPLQRAVTQLGQLGHAGVAALAEVLEFLPGLRQIGSDSALADFVETHLQLNIIAAIARAAKHQPELLQLAYRASEQAQAKDSLCEAAAKLAATHAETPAQLMAMMLDHLEENAFVASLCLAENGNPAALPRLQARLREEVVGRPGPRAVGAGASLRALHVKGLVEGIEALGGRVEPALVPLVAQASARGCYGLAPLVALDAEPPPRLA